MARVAAALLTLEALVFVLAIPVMISVADLRPAVAVPLGLGAVAAALVAAGLCRRGRIGYIAGSVVQVLAVAGGFIVPAIFAIGGIFAVLWIVLMRIGPGVDAASAD
ncbi:MAG TPA: DUF4233 domain-containing protein [Jiangellaceae bacterium]